MKALVNGYGERVFAISDKEWFDELTFGMKAEDIIAKKLADTFTDKELRKLVKIDMKKVEKRVVEMVAERVVDSCMKSSAFKEENEDSKTNRL